SSSPIAIADVRWDDGSLTILPLSGTRETVENLRGSLHLSEALTSAYTGRSGAEDKLPSMANLIWKQPASISACKGSAYRHRSCRLLSPPFPLEPTAGVADVELQLVWQPGTPLAIGGSAQFRETTLPITGLPEP
ncbi:MAG: hypothetical protein HC926_03955, partial [Synechococcaceae cyanobacterium SM2_3_60]|nr:hypothetical protein [Synechococcaceae cyanobacterium SM2_3_60]